MKKILCLLACLFIMISCAFTETPDITFINIPCFPAPQNIKQIAQDFNFTLVKYEDMKLTYSCDIQNNGYSISNVQYNFGNIREVLFTLNSSDEACYSLLTAITNKPEYKLMDIAYLKISSTIIQSYINDTLGIIAAVEIPDSQVYNNGNFDYHVSFQYIPGLINQNKIKEQ